MGSSRGGGGGGRASHGSIARPAAGYRQGHCRRSHRPPMPQALRHTLLSFRDLLATAGPFVLLALLGAARRWPTGCSTRRRRSRWCWPPASDQGAYAEFGRRYAADARGARHHVELRATAGRGGEPRSCCATRRRASTSLSCRAAPTTRRGAGDDDRPQRRPGLARQPVLRAGVAVLPRETSAQRLLKARRRSPRWRSCRLARQHRRAGQRRAQPDAPAARGQPHRRRRRSRCARAADAGRGRPARRQIDALVLASAPESLMVQMLLQTPGVAAVRLRAGRGLFAPLPLPERR